MTNDEIKLLLNIESLKFKMMDLNKKEFTDSDILSLSNKANKLIVQLIKKKKFFGRK